MNISVLDCSLRDGGYLNDWNFGNRAMLDTFTRLNSSGIECVEIGFLDDRREFDENRSIQPDTRCYDKIYKNIKTKKTTVVAMIDYGTCSIDHVGLCENSFIDGIRIIFKKPNMYKAVEFAQQIKKKGYKVFLQLVSITSYSDRDMLDFIEAANKIDPYAISIVDTYGLMHKEKMLHYFHLLDFNLKPDIKIGFHSHNNFQLAYANAIELVKQKTNHDIILDGSVFGIGKNAGNTPLELLCMYLNDNEGKEYHISHILEIIDLTAFKIYSQTPWGYSMPLFLASSNDCHPNYVMTLMKKNTLSISSVNCILKQLEGNDKLNYNGKLIEELYRKYQQTTLSDKNKESLFNELTGGRILLIGPGLSVIRQEAEIRHFIEEKKPIVISVNCVPEFTLDYVFIGNSKKYSILSAVCALKEGSKIIATSNISSINNEFDYVLNFEKLTDDDELLFDNSLIMILKILSEANVNKVFLAGFDGFSKDAANYYDDFLEFNADGERLQMVNDLIRSRINKFSKSLQIQFVTKSYYSEK